MITVVIPTVAPRQQMLNRALKSVAAQTLQPADVIVVTDTERQGAPLTRQRGLEAVKTKLVAFLDDDDEFLPQHLERCREHLYSTGADLVYPWFHVVGGTDPFPQFYGRPWDPQAPHHTTVTVLARTDALLAVGGFLAEGPDNLDNPDDPRAGEEYRMVLALNSAGYWISHLPERTWNWHHHGQNTSGLPRKVRW